MKPSTVKYPEGKIGLSMISYAVSIATKISIVIF